MVGIGGLPRHTSLATFLLSMTKTQHAPVELLHALWAKNSSTRGDAQHSSAIKCWAGSGGRRERQQRAGRCAGFPALKAKSNMPEFAPRESM